MQQCSIPYIYSTCRDVLHVTGLYPKSSNTYKCGVWVWPLGQALVVVNPRHMREGYGSYSVCVCVCMSVTEIAATYHAYTLKVGCH